MNAVRLSIPQNGIEALVQETAKFGRAQLETGGFLLAHSGESEVCGVAMAGMRGIVRRHNIFQISSPALDRLFSYATAAGLWIPAQFHSHRFRALMSLSDEQHGLRAEGFISTIIPDFALPPANPAAWGWWQFSRGDWVPIASVSLCPKNIMIIVDFDEGGVRDR